MPMPLSRRSLPTLALIFFALGACGRETGPSLTAPQALDMAQAGKLTIVDIRRPEEWRQTGVAAGAVRLDMRRPDFAAALLAQAGGDRAAPIALICRTGNRTTQMQRALLQAGFTHIYNIDEGMAGSAAGPGWIRRGLPMTPCAQC